MTTLTNQELVAEFGWTMEVIHNSTGGRLPALCVSCFLAIAEYMRTDYSRQLAPSIW